MNKKGFTIIEVLVTLIILSMIAMISSNILQKLLRKNIETTGIVPEEPIALSGQIKNTIPILDSKTNLTQELTEDYSQSSFPISDKKFKGRQQTAQLHIDQYFQSDYPNSYKFSRNNLMGIECSTKFSPWLSLGFISANQIYSALKRYEQRNSANDSTYWIYFTPNHSSKTYLF